jgi:hypothetical protein
MTTYIRAATFSKRILGVELKDTFPTQELQQQLFIRRLNVNMDRFELAAIVGYDVHTVERWELTPNRKIALKTLVDWANGLGYDLEFKLTKR